MPPQQRAIFHTIHHDRVAVPNIPNDKSPVFREFFIYRVRIRDQLRSIIFVKIIFRKRNKKVESQAQESASGAVTV